MSDAQNDLQHFLRLAKAQVESRLRKLKDEGQVELGDELLNLKILEELLREQIPQKDML